MIDRQASYPWQRRQTWWTERRVMSAERDLCSTCGTARSADDVRIAVRAPMTLGHYVHYASGHRARDAVLSTIIAVAGSDLSVVRLCPLCVCRGIGLSDPEVETD